MRKLKHIRIAKDYFLERLSPEVVAKRYRLSVDRVKAIARSFLDEYQEMCQRRLTDFELGELIRLEEMEFLCDREIQKGGDIAKYINLKDKILRSRREIIFNAPIITSSTPDVKDIARKRIELLINEPQSA